MVGPRAGLMSAGAEVRRVLVFRAPARVDARLDRGQVERGEPDEGNQQDEQELHGPGLLSRATSLV